jgi:hypothetical protein
VVGMLIGVYADIELVRGAEDPVSSAQGSALRDCIPLMGNLGVLKDPSGLATGASGCENGACGY